MMLDKILSPIMSSKVRKVYGHYDYFGYLIPCTWFIVASAISVFLVFGPSIDCSDDTICAEIVKAIENSNAGTMFVLGLVLVVVGFNFVYAIGHILSSLSALLIDRGLVRKVLGYPFSMYGTARRLLKKNEYSEFSSSRIGLHILRGKSDTVSLFWRYISNSIVFSALIILILLEYFDSFVSRLSLFWVIPLYALLSIVCIGLPGLAYNHAGETYIDKDAELIDAIRLTKRKGIVVSFHITAVVLLTVSTTILSFILRSSFVSLLVFVVIPVMLLIVSKTLYLKRSFANKLSYCLKYIGLSLPSIPYWVAKRVNYHRCPSRVVLLEDSNIKDVSDTSDEYWLANIAADHIHGEAHSSLYHFRSMYGMNRNLCAAVTVPIGLSALFIFVHKGCEHPVALTCYSILLMTLGILFFARYLYLYSCYYCKYLIRYTYFIETISSKQDSEESKENG
ncbi:MAG: hypothetical protein GF388_00130 [Candidatus Aegiribacteria sp.]|nr:hypothetical protein [Candidatus Aegiribacteria sp.]